MWLVGAKVIVDVVVVILSTSLVSCGDRLQVPNYRVKLRYLIDKWVLSGKLIYQVLAKQKSIF